MIRYLAAAVTALALVLPSPGRCDGNAGMIYGRVLLSTTHQPVCPITVRVLSNREGPWEAHTQSDGSFVFLQVRPGPVSIVIGRGREVRSVNVSANLQEQQTFYLEPLRHARTRSACSANAYGGYLFTDYDANGSWLR
jgi:hypothetical protein